MRDSRSNKVIIEACVTSTRSAVAAQQGGVDRVELCDNLHDGGTTPGPGSIILARKHLNIDLNVILRPRGGDFLYSDLEFEIMKSEVEFCRKHDVDGVVFGILKPDGTIDRDRCRKLVALAGDMSTTCHRAFDMTRDPFEALEELVDLGIDRVLTSGQQPSALLGIDLLSTLVRTAGDRIIIMPGCGITADNIGEIMRKSGADEFHLHDGQPSPSGMAFKNPDVFMGTDPDLSEYETELTDAHRIQAVCEAARQELNRQGPIT